MAEALKILLWEDMGQLLEVVHVEQNEGLVPPISLDFLSL
jgi:hypothetical protein